MKTKLLIIAIFALGMFAAPAFAQVDPGNMDTAQLIMSSQPNAGSEFTLELWCYSDEIINGATMGFSWDNANIMLDSAVSTPLIDAAFDLGRFFYFESDINLSNANKLFMFGGSKLFSSGLVADAGQRRLWATYYFSTLPAWDPLVDTVVFDTNQFNDGSVYKFAAPANNEIFPMWGGSFKVGDVTPVSPELDKMLPTVFALEQNYPNPFNPATKISFDVPAASHVRISVFNVLGQQVGTIVNTELEAGTHSATWDAGSKGLASGLYFYRMKAGDFVQTRKMMLLK